MLSVHNYSAEISWVLSGVQEEALLLFRRDGEDRKIEINAVAMKAHAKLREQRRLLSCSRILRSRGIAKAKGVPVRYEVPTRPLLDWPGYADPRSTACVTGRC